MSESCYLCRQEARKWIAQLVKDTSSKLKVFSDANVDAQVRGLCKFAFSVRVSLNSFTVFIFLIGND